MAQEGIKKKWGVARIMPLDKNTLLVNVAQVKYIDMRFPQNIVYAAITCRNDEIWMSVRPIFRVDFFR